MITSMVYMHFVVISHQPYCIICIIRCVSPRPSLQSFYGWRRMEVQGGIEDFLYDVDDSVEDKKRQQTILPTLSSHSEQCSRQ